MTDEVEVRALNLQKMWGSSGFISFPGPAFEGDPVTDTRSVSQFADIRLPEPAVCAIFYQAYVNQGADGSIDVLTIDLNLGLGRTATTVRKSYQLQPSALAPLEVVIAAQPFQNLMATGSATGRSTTIGQAYTITLVLEVSPISRHHMGGEPLVFGMALPGESEGRDETTFEESEAQSPELVDAMRRMRSEQGTLMDVPDAPRPSNVTPERDALIRSIIATLRTRHGRPPTKEQVRKALASHDARARLRAR